VGHGTGPAEERAPRAHANRLLVVLAGAFDAAADATPLSDAEKPALDRMARVGRCGVLRLDARSSWDGFAAMVAGEGRAPSLGAAEALGLGVAVGPGEVAYRADFVTLGDRGLSDPFGGKVRDPEASSLLDAVRAAAPSARLARAGGHRNVCVLPAPEGFCPSPWEMVGRRPASGLPADGPVRDLYETAARVLAQHDVNAVRVDLRENPANALWLHGGGAGTAGSPPGEGAAVLVGRGAATAGLALAAGLRSVVVEGDDDVLAAAALAEIARGGLVIVRTESVMDAAVAGAAAKRDALSRADARLVAPLLAAMEERDSWIAAVAADSAIDAETRALSRRPVPLAVASSDGGPGAGAAAFTERACETSGWHLGGPAEVLRLLA
jgi:2,3-bisphosphoglycerate-independent phosphoglycerate mutase